MTAALLDRLTRRCNILKTSNDSYGFKVSAKAAKNREGDRNIDRGIIHEACLKVGQLLARLLGQLSVKINSFLNDILGDVLES